MSQTPSNMIPLGSTAPDFELPDTASGLIMSLSDLRSDTATVLMFICNHCPFVKHLQTQLVAVANNYKNKGINFVAISSNDATHYPADAPEFMKLEAETLHYPFPYLYDETQDVAKAYQAACTPDFYIFDANLTCVYRGQFDDSRPGTDIPVTGQDLSAALDAIIAGEPVNADQKPSIGCNIKWK